MVLRTLILVATAATVQARGCGVGSVPEGAMHYSLSEDAPDPEPNCKNEGDCPAPPVVWDEVDGNEPSHEREEYKRLDVKVDWKAPKFKGTQLDFGSEEECQSGSYP